MIDDWVNDYVGVPYLVNGRDRDGWDCWGLVMAVYQERLGISLPDWRVDLPAIGLIDPSASADKITEAVATESKKSVQLMLPAPWSIAVVRRHRLAYHVGVVTEGGKMLHCSIHSRGTSCQSLAQFLREFPNTTFWQWNG